MIQTVSLFVLYYQSRGNAGGCRHPMGEKLSFWHCQLPDGEKGCSNQDCVTGAKDAVAPGP